MAAKVPCSGSDMIELVQDMCMLQRRRDLQR
jgi:hypothetical protein